MIRSCDTHPDSVLDADGSCVTCLRETIAALRTQADADKAQIERLLLNCRTEKDRAIRAEKERDAFAETRDGYRERMLEHGREIDRLRKEHDETIACNAEALKLMSAEVGEVEQERDALRKDLDAAREALREIGASAAAHCEAKARGEDVPRVSMWWVAQQAAYFGNAIAPQPVVPGEARVGHDPASANCSRQEPGPVGEPDRVQLQPQPDAAAAEVCADCGGMGEITRDIIAWHGDSPDHDTATHECPTCSGTGRTKRGEKGGSDGR